MFLLDPFWRWHSSFSQRACPCDHPLCTIQCATWRGWWQRGPCDTELDFESMLPRKTQPGIWGSTRSWM